MPTVLGMVACDAVWRDPETGKMTLLGTFTRRATPALPVELDQVCAYFEMSGHQGTVTIRGRLFHTGDETDDLLASTEATVTFADRLVVVGTAITFYNVDLPAFGEYYVELSVADQVLADRRLFIDPLAGPEDL